MSYELEGMILNPFTGKEFYGRILISQGKIHSIEPSKGNSPNIITCGLIDAHVHIESSLLTPREYVKLALAHGVIGCMADPHEIANVLGITGVRYMIENGKNLPFHFFWGASPCVPATPFETAGGALSVEEVKELLDQPEVTHLAEVMNWPGVINKDPRLIEMISYARQIGKAVDAHAPGLEGENAWKYFTNLGPSADHECSTLREAREKCRYSGKITIREGSAAKNFEALSPLLLDKDYIDFTMFCADDAHPDFLLKKRSYILEMVKRAVDMGVPLLSAITVATANPISHYKLPIGRMNVGDPADLIVIDSFQSFEIQSVYVKGQLAYDNNQAFVPEKRITIINNFKAMPISAADLSVPEKSSQIRVIGIIPEELVTDTLIRPSYSVNGNLESNTNTDILKYVLLNRYAQNSEPAIAFVQGMGLKKGAIASSVGHDSHNIGCIGVDDESMAQAINLIIEHKGGLALVDGPNKLILPLPIAGIMSDRPCVEVARLYSELDSYAKNVLGSKLPAPFMALSFLCLTVIPSLKLSDKGLFDGDSFRIIPLEV